MVVTYLQVQALILRSLYLDLNLIHSLFPSFENHKEIFPECKTYYRSTGKAALDGAEGLVNCERRVQGDF